MSILPHVWLYTDQSVLPDLCGTFIETIGLISTGLYGNGIKRDSLTFILASVALLPLVKATYVPVTVPAPNIGSAFQSTGMFCICLKAVCLLWKCRIIGWIACSRVNIHTFTCLHTDTRIHMYKHTYAHKNMHK